MKKYFLIIIISLAAILLSCSKEKDNPVEPEQTTITYNIKYRVTGTGACIDAFLTFHNKNDDTSQESAAVLPWTYSFSTTEPDFFLYISAQNNYDTGSITTYIFINGKEKKKSTSTGAYVIATSSGTAGM